MSLLRFRHVLSPLRSFGAARGSRAAGLYGRDLVQFFGSTASRRDQHEGPPSATQPFHKFETLWGSKETNRNEALTNLFKDNLSNPSSADTARSKFVLAVNSALSPEDARLEELMKIRHDHEEELQVIESRLESMDAAADRHANRAMWLGASYLLTQGSLLAYITWAPELKERMDIDIMPEWWAFDPWDQGWEQWGWDFAEPVTYFLGWGTGVLGVSWYLATKHDFEYPVVRQLVKCNKLDKLKAQEGFDAARFEELKELIAADTADIESIIGKGSERPPFVTMDDPLVVTKLDLGQAITFALDTKGSSARKDLQNLQQNLDAMTFEYSTLDANKQHQDQRALRKAHRHVWYGGAGLLGLYGVLYNSTYTWFSWDLVEPCTYFLGFSSVLVGATWFMTTQTEYSYEAVMHHSMDKFKRKYYRSRGVNARRHSELAVEIEETRRSIAHLQIRRAHQLTLP